MMLEYFFLTGTIIFKDLDAFVDGVKEEVDFLQISLKNSFCTWVEQLEKGNKNKCLTFDKNNALYISFNYTDTLEYLYKIPERQILYIHGKAESSFSQLIFGHHYSESQINDMMPNDNELEEEAITEIANLLTALKKDSGSIIEKNDSFFQVIKNVKYVYVLGHSLADVDFLYFKKIKEVVPTDTKWVVSYYTSKDFKKSKDLQQRLDIPYDHFTPIMLDKISDEFTPKLF